LAAVLARHFAEAGEPARALGYYVAAGEHAMQRYANAEAAMHFGRAIEIQTTEDGRRTTGDGRRQTVEDAVDAVRHEAGLRTDVAESSASNDVREPPASAVAPRPDGVVRRPPSRTPGNAPGQAAQTGTSLVELYTKRGRALELCGQYTEAFANYQAM